MSEAHEQDRWRELADLLGLPPEKNGPARPAAPARPAPKPDDQFQTWVEPEPAAPQRGRPDAKTVDERPFAGAEAELPEAYVGDERSPGTPELEAPPVSAPGAMESREPGLGEPEAREQGDSSDDRPRRGRRRGRRGQRGHDGDDRGRERGPRREEVRQPAASSSADDEPVADVEEDGGRHGRHLEPARHEAVEEEPLDIEEMDRPEPMREEDDDEEVDRLTDLNLPSWTDLIASLYRPER